MAVHVHGFFPYFYIKVQQHIHHFKSTQFIIKFFDQIHQAYQTVYLRDFKNKENFRIIYNYELVQKYDFYGVHNSKEWFLQIRLYDQQYMSNLVDLLNSGIIMNYKFQPYESHLGYFMQFYAETNIYGYNQVELQQYTLRKRMKPHLEQIFNNDQFDILESIPQKYQSIIPKITTCGLELDVHYTYIVNQRFIDERSDLEMLQILRRSQSSNLDELIYQFNVEITLTLNKLWNDEKNAREKQGIVEELQLYIDKSKNLEGNEKQVDQFWNEGLEQELKEHLLQYVSSNNSSEQYIGMKQQDEIVNYNKINDFFNQKQIEKQECLNLMNDRFKEYVNRKQDLWRLIKKGVEVEYEYKFGQEQEDIGIDIKDDSDVEDDLNSIVQGSQSMLQEQNAFEVLIRNQKIKEQNKNRKKYKVSKLIQKKQIIDPFEQCDFCGRSYFKCQCFQFQSTPQDEPLQSARYAYNLIMPSVYEVLDSLTQNENTSIPQFCYYSDVKDLYEHYSIKHKQLPSRFILAQYFAKNHIRVPYNRFHAISLKNTSQLPNLYDVSIQNYKISTKQPNLSQPTNYLYLPQMPSVRDVLADLQKKNQKVQVQIDTNLILVNSQPSQPSQQQTNFKGEEDYLHLLLFDVFLSKPTPLLPDISMDSITFLVFNFSSLTDKIANGIILVNKDLYNLKSNGEITNLHISIGLDQEIEIFLVQDEIDLIFMFCLLVFMLDPDFIGGYDLEQRSLHYLNGRCNRFDMNLLEMLSRGQGSYEEVLNQISFDEFHFECNKFQTMMERYVNVKIQHCLMEGKERQSQQLEMRQREKKKMEIAYKKKQKFKQFIVGRILVNVWRHAATELKLTNYDLQEVYYQIFKIKKPRFENKQLSSWYSQKDWKSQLKVYHYYLDMVNQTYQIFQFMDIIPRTLEISKLYGCEYDSVSNRGGQFKIECVLNRVTKINDYLLLSATKYQVATQKILECVPLVIEPPKIFTVDPVLVFDFQSLYPSIMIAYNFCFSTCLGNITEAFNSKQEKRFGVCTTKIDFDLDSQSIEELIRKVHIAPNKVAFLKKEVKEGIIPRILIEFLFTRIMQKKSQRLYNDPKHKKRYSFRQLALKLFMNIMYGYCGASFSGRMPCGDIADSVVSTGRALLNQCIQYIQENWKARVIYGDTDSLFVLFKGIGMEQAFQYGQEIAAKITARYPYPIELKFEKAYSSLFLLAKKRYGGLKQERLEDKAELDCKGIEIVRRDGCDAVVKLMKKCMNLVLQKDLTKLKQTMYEEWSKILNGHYNVKDFIIAKEVKLGKYKNAQSMPAHGIVATKMMERDIMLTPKHGERIGYLVIQGNNEKARVKDLVISVQDYDRSQELNKFYYIKKQINASLGRLMTCFDVDIEQWYQKMPKEIAKKSNGYGQGVQKGNLLKFFMSNLCIICYNQSNNEICDNCLCDSNVTIYLLQQRVQKYEMDQMNLNRICQSCSGEDSGQCVQQNCGIMFSVGKINQKQQKCRAEIDKYLEIMEFLNR